MNYRSESTRESVHGFFLFCSIFFKHSDLHKCLFFDARCFENAYGTTIQYQVLGWCSRGHHETSSSPPEGERSRHSAISAVSCISILLCGLCTLMLLLPSLLSELSFSQTGPWLSYLIVFVLCPSSVPLCGR